MKLLLSNAETHADLCNAESQTPLMLAAQGNHASILTLLLQRDDIRINSTDKNGNTALHHACDNGVEDIVKQMIEKHPKKFIRNNNDDTALVAAAKADNAEAVKAILLDMLPARNISAALGAYFHISLELISHDLARDRIVGCEDSIIIDFVLEQKYSHKF